MKPIWICLAVIIGLSSAVPLDKLDDEALIALLKSGGLAKNSALENALTGLLEDLRKTMVTGSGSVPVLDPFTAAHISLDDSVIPIPGARFEVNNLEVSKLSTFELKQVSVSVVSLLQQRYNVVVDVEVPVIEVDVEKYNIFASTGGLSIFGNGDAKILLIKPRLKVTLEIGVQIRIGAIYLNVRSTRIEFSLGDFKPAITGMFGHPAADDFVNLFLRNLVLEALAAYSEDLTTTISPIVQNYANNILADLNVIDLIS